MHGMGGGRRYFDKNISAFAALLLLLSSFFSEIGAQIGYQKDYRLLGLQLATNRHIHSLAVLK